jgi:hypothetical protein
MLIWDLVFSAVGVISPAALCCSGRRNVLWRVASIAKASFVMLDELSQG